MRYQTSDFLEPYILVYFPNWKWEKARLSKVWLYCFLWGWEIRFQDTELFSDSWNMHDMSRFVDMSTALMSISTGFKDFCFWSDCGSFKDGLQSCLFSASSFHFFGSGSRELVLDKLGLIPLLGSALTNLTVSFGHDVAAGWIILVFSRPYLAIGKTELQERNRGNFVVNSIYLYFEIHTRCLTASCLCGHWGQKL